MLALDDDGALSELAGADRGVVAAGPTADDEAVHGFTVAGHVLSWGL
jgi:hypothetical protein